MDRLARTSGTNRVDRWAWLPKRSVFGRKHLQESRDCRTSARLGLEPLWHVGSGTAVAQDLVYTVRPQGPAPAGSGGELGDL